MFIIKKYILGLLLAVLGLTSFATEASAYTRREERRAQRVVLDLLDKAREEGQITAAERFRLGVVLRFQREKCCELLESIVPEAAAFDGQEPALYGAEVAAEGEQLYQLDLDPDNIAKILDLLFKYLPQIIDLIKTLF